MNLVNGLMIVFSSVETERVSDVSGLSLLVLWIETEWLIRSANCEIIAVYKQNERKAFNWKLGIQDVDCGKK